MGGQGMSVDPSYWQPDARAPRVVHPHPALSHTTEHTAMRSERRKPALPHWQTLAKAEMQKVASMFGIYAYEIPGPSQKARVVAARHEFCLRLHESGKYSSGEIGRLIDRHHTSVLHAIEAGKKRRAQAPKTAAVDSGEVQCPDYSGEWSI